MHAQYQRRWQLRGFRQVGS